MLDIRPVRINWRYQGKMDIKPSAEVKKCLFGEPEHDNLQTDLKQQLGEIQKADRLRWNYDFRSDEPLPGGRYQWEKVDIVARSGSSGSSEDAEASETESDTSLCSSSTKFSPSSRMYPLTARPSATDSPSTQRIISEYFPQIKRRCSPSTVTDETRVKRLRGSPLRDHIDRPPVSRTLNDLFVPIDKPDSLN